VKSGRIIEIFSSIQGEGLWLGRPQVFVRFHGCKLKCNYCDTPLTHHRINSARIEWPPYSRQFENQPLEFSVSALNQQIARFGITSLAITGGEPLEQQEFLSEWLPTCSAYDILLETSGVEFAALEKVLPFVSIVSMDVKIPTSTGERSYWKEHEKFLEIASQKECYAKVVFDERLADSEITEIKNLMKKFSGVSFIFQPVSPLQKRDVPKILNIFNSFASEFPKQVRLVPQVHKFLGVM